MQSQLQLHILHHMEFTVECVTRDSCMGRKSGCAVPYSGSHMHLNVFSFTHARKILFEKPTIPASEQKHSKDQERNWEAESRVIVKIIDAKHIHYDVSEE